MALLDDVNRILRDHEGYTGDAQGGLGALPIGDTSTARKPISKRDLRELLILIAQTVGDPEAMADLLASINGALSAPASSLSTDAVRALRQTNGTFLLGWDALQVQTPGGVRTLNARTLTNVPTGFAVMAPLTGSGALTAVNAAYDAALLERARLGEVIILASVVGDQVTGILAPQVVRNVDRYSAAFPLSYHGLGVIEAHAADPSLETGRRTFEVATPGWYLLQTAEDNASYAITQASCVVDLTHLPTGRSAVISAPSGCAIFSGGAAFSGQTGTMATLPAGAVARVLNLNGLRVVEAISGSVTYSTVARPAMTRSVLWAGQSHIEGGCPSGTLGGFTDALMAGTLTGGVDHANTYHIIAGAGNSAALRSSSETRYWWDGAAGQPGPHLVDAVTKINDAIAAGQPLPTAMIWKLGETDTPAIGSGLTTYAQFKAALLSIFGHLRVTAPNMQVIVSPPGANDVPIGFTGMMGVRTAYLELAAENSWIHYGSEMYDLPRPYGNVHPTDQGYYIAGIRDAMAYRQALAGASVNMGPRMTSAVLQSDGSVVVTIATDTNSAFYSAEEPGPYPYGLCIVNHEQGVSGPATVRRGKAVVTTGVVTITLYPLTSVAGMRVFSIAGWANDVRRRGYIRDMRLHGRSPGLPLQFQRLGPL